MKLNALKGMVHAVALFLLVVVASALTTGALASLPPNPGTICFDADCCEICSLCDAPIVDPLDLPPYCETDPDGQSRCSTSGEDCELCSGYCDPDPIIRGGDPEKCGCLFK